jgi:hypothetical protein
MIAVSAAAEHQLVTDGFEIIPDVLPSSECDRIGNSLVDLHKTRRESSHRNRGGLRNLLTSPQVREVAYSAPVKSLPEGRVGKRFFPIRALFFDKTSDANWFVPWHQDLMVAVALQKDVEGFEAWCTKEGTIHVQPPLEILEDIVTIRLHLDDCAADNGALRVIPGSHSRGKLRAAEITRIVKGEHTVICEVSKGGALLMRPLLLHSSTTVQEPTHRRVLDIQYATKQLPGGLRWCA